MNTALLLALVLGTPPAHGFAASQLYAQAQEHLSCGRSFDAEVLLRRLVAEQPLSSEALKGARQLGLLARFGPTRPLAEGDADDRQVSPRPAPADTPAARSDARRLLQLGATRAALERLGGSTQDLDLAVDLARALARDSVAGSGRRPARVAARRTPEHTGPAAASPSPNAAWLAHIEGLLEGSRLTLERAQQLTRHQAYRHPGSGF
jgi:hypothetical protein